MNQNVDKVNMSLDDIIKLNKRQNRFGGAAKNGAGGGSNQNNRQQNQQRNNNNAGGRNNNNRVRFNQQHQGGAKPFGMLKKSKAIQKKRAATNIQRQNMNGGGGGGNAGSRMQTLARIKRRRTNPNNLQNRFANRVGTNIQRRKRGPAIQNRQQKQQPQQQQQIMRKSAIKQLTEAARLQPPRRMRNQSAIASTKSKIAMQAARKNVQKAKRTLANRKGPIQQIMTQRYAKNLLAATNALTKPVRRQRRPTLLKKTATLVAKPRRVPNIVKVGASSKSRRGSQIIRVQQQPFKQKFQPRRPVVKRTRGNRAKPIAQRSAAGGKNRMVFY